MDKRFKKKISKSLLGIATSASILTGCAVNNKPSSKDSDKIVDIDYQTREWLSDVFGNDIDTKYTVGDLGRMNDLLVVLDNDNSLDWLNYCTKINSVTFIIDKFNAIDRLKDIKELPNLEVVCFLDYCGSFLDEETLSFINKDKLSELILYGNSTMDKNYLSSLKELKKLTLSSHTAYNANINTLLRLDKLSTLDLKDKPYTASMYITTEEYNALVAKGIDVKFDKEEYKEEFLNTNEQLASIANDLGLNTDISDKQKLDNILIYTMDNYEYDMDVNEKLNNGEKVDTTPFYQNGFLYAAMNGNGKIICGNYTAIVGALSHRAGLDNQFIRGEGHAFNLVSIDGEYYYVDATVLDALNYYSADNNYVSNKIVSDDVYDLNWYLKAYNPEETYEGMHSVISTTYRDLNAIIEDQDGIYSFRDISQDKYCIKVNNEQRIINGAMLVGILVAFGGAIKVNKKKQSKRVVKRR